MLFVLHQSYQPYYLYNLCICGKLLVEALNAGLLIGVDIANSHTIVSGLRAPKVIEDLIMLDVLRQSSGAAVALLLLMLKHFCLIKFSLFLGMARA